MKCPPNAKRMLKKFTMQRIHIECEAKQSLELVEQCILKALSRLLSLALYVYYLFQLVFQVCFAFAIFETEHAHLSVVGYFIFIFP